MEDTVLVLWLICFCGTTIDTSTRLAIASTCKRFRCLLWNEEDQRTYQTRHDRALIYTWGEAMIRHLYATLFWYKFHESNFLELNKSRDIAKMVAWRLPRACKKYCNGMRHLFRIVLNALEEDHPISSCACLPNIGGERHYNFLCIACVRIDTENIRNCITKFSEHLERNGYEWEIEFSRDLFEQGESRILLQQVCKDPVEDMSLDFLDKFDRTKRH